MSSGEQAAVTTQQQEAFHTWLAQQPAPVPGISGNRPELQALEQQLCDFCHSPHAYCLQLPSLTAVERLWMRGRAVCLGLIANDEPNADFIGHIDLVLSKPWLWNLERAKLIDRQEELQAERQQRRVRATAKVRLLHERQARWRAKCRGCRATLDAWCARYHCCEVHDLGPYCHHCINETSHLQDFDWECAKDLLNWRLPQPNIG